MMFIFPFCKLFPFSVNQILTLLKFLHMNKEHPEWSSGFPHFLQLKSEFGDKEFTTVSSWPCFWWRYRASPSLAVKNIGIDHLVMAMWKGFSCAVGRGCLLWPVHSLGKIWLGFALLHSVLQGQICLLLQVFLDFLLLHFTPLYWKGHFFWVLVLEGLLVPHRTVQLQLLQHYCSGRRLGLLWYWMVCLGKEQRSFYLISNNTDYILTKIKRKMAP